MTDVQLTAFQGLTAAFDLGSPLTLLSGPNGAGKSRIARALAAVLSDTPTPITGKKGDLRECLTTDGEPRASVVLRDGYGLRAMVWTEGRCEPSVKGEQGTLPRASRYAAGLVSLLTLTGKERAAGFAEVFRTEPTKKEFVAAVREAGLDVGATAFEGFWSQLEINGWDAVTKDAENKARTLKGRWNEATGATWGERVAETWEPDATQFADPGALKLQLQQAEEGLEHAKQALDAQKAERAKLPERADEVSGTTCPWCEKPVSYQFGKLVKVEQPKRSSKELREIQQAIAGADGNVANAQDQIHHQERAVGAAQARIDDAARAREQAKSRAAELHQQIMEQLDIARICGPSGLRKTKLEEVLNIVNNDLLLLAENTGLPLLEISPDLEAALAGTAYHRLSRAESWLARTIMQIMVAQCDGSTTVVIDDLDVLAAPRDRNNVLDAICQSNLTAVVLQASWDVGDTQRTPDLAAAGYGLSYWLQQIYEDMVDEETGEVMQRLKEIRVCPIAEARGKQEAA